MDGEKRDHTLKLGCEDYSVQQVLRCHTKLTNKTRSATHYYKECPIILRYHYEIYKLQFSPGEAKAGMLIQFSSFKAMTSRVITIKKISVFPLSKGEKKKAILLSNLELLIPL